MRGCHDLLAKVDSTVTENGEKAKWARIGVLLEKEKGFSIKLDFIPVSTTWDGWLTVKERKEKEQTEEPF